MVSSSHHQHLSANQLKLTILKACIGVGVARGVAEDVADACLVLLSQGHDPLRSMISCIKKHHVLRECRSPNRCLEMELGNSIVLTHGPSILDLAQAGSTVSCTIDCLILLLGLAEARFHCHGTRFELRRNGGKWFDVAEMLANIDHVQQDVRITLRLREFIRPEPPVMKGLVRPSNQDWKEIEQLARSILVPADRSSRADAGAGVNDNE